MVSRSSVPQAAEDYVSSESDDVSGRVEGIAERFVPGPDADQTVAAEHWARYMLTAQLARGKRVLDAGCGVGYGSALLARSGAAEVTGVDRSSTAIAAASVGAPENANFILGDVTKLPVDDASIDLVVCFEVVEHIAEQGQLLDELRRVMAPGALLIISSPNRDVYLAGNPHHVRELTPSELSELLEPRFAHFEMMHQHPWAASAILSDADFTSGQLDLPLSATSVKLAPASPGEETFTIAIASDSELPQLSGITIITDPTDLRGHTESIKALETQLDELRASEQAAEKFAEQAALQAAAQDERILNLDEQCARATAVNEELTNSLSWRITSPLRKLKALSKR
ncbi:MAG: class I SAM-dependent methyltransferase [Actinomycetes bacterium]